MDDFEAHRDHLWGIAYRILGSVADADDAVQEAWLRWRRAGQADVENARAYLTTVVSRVCYDALTSARARRESYVGEWLPEPVVSEPGPEDRATLDESVSVALLAVLERLSPAERTAFVLHDIFGMPFEEIASVLGRSAGAVRQLASRARGRVREYGPRRTPPRAVHLKVVEAFTAAATTGDLPALVAALDPDVVWHTDGGGVVTASMVPVAGAPKVARLVLGLVNRWLDGMSIAFRDVNGAPGVVVLTADGEVDSVVAFTVDDDRVTRVDVMRNPNKLRHISV
ncbi:RNA polymerase sigma factor SigJ [Spongiactinospora sp. TRM90649]|uniref:RNA polymerase sigma factor SigJ n=1 Tax=Spongiactinospora sp. TRM90649 TaxID=3031114 RepID=UPI0023F8448C|nr:RNA polymerase sigma factor SigJ [Spongiactinospora sp. TRM90649]MDF5757860.1 RNA polymerase sigma factor SigJ [Spongiactinospora sp. TRM90649]